MSRYSIEGSTLTAIGDAVRGKAGETRLEPFPVESYKYYFNSEEEDYTQWDKNLNLWFKKILHFPVTKEASKYKFKYDMIFGSDFDSISLYGRDKDGISRGTSYIFNRSTNNSSEEIMDMPIFGSNETIAYYEIIVDVHDYSARTKMEVDLELTPLDSKNNIITEELLPVFNTMTPTKMAEAIDNLTTFPEEAFTISGDCRYRFAHNGWNWFINEYRDKITTKDIQQCDHMFYICDVSEIPFDINIKEGFSDLNFEYFFNNCQMKSAPYIYLTNPPLPTTHAKAIGMDYMFAGAHYLRTIPYDFFEKMAPPEFWEAAKNYGPDRNNMFAACYSLRQLPNLSPLNHMLSASYYYSYCLYNNLANQCYALDEVINLPVLDLSLTTSNGFANAFRQCYRIKNVTFMTNADGSPIEAKWTNQTIELSGANYNSQGFVISSSESTLTAYNSGITQSKRVTDDASYQALKNDPDWYALSSDYSRYNHDSAVATINSLPDTSSGSGNVIKFLGVAGAKTDGGAINTLTEEEIAVATAKGWTVTLV